MKRWKRLKAKKPTRLALTNFLTFTLFHQNKKPRLLEQVRFRLYIFRLWINFDGISGKTFCLPLRLTTFCIPLLYTKGYSLLLSKNSDVNSKIISIEKLIGRSRQNFVWKIIFKFGISCAVWVSANIHSAYALFFLVSVISSRPYFYRVLYWCKQL